MISAEKGNDYIAFEFELKAHIHSYHPMPTGHQPTWLIQVLYDENFERNPSMIFGASGRKRTLIESLMIMLQAKVWFFCVVQNFMKGITDACN